MNYFKDHKSCVICDTHSKDIDPLATANAHTQTIFKLILIKIKNDFAYVLLVQKNVFDDKSM